MSDTLYIGFDPAGYTGIGVILGDEAWARAFDIEKPDKGWRFEQIEQAILELTYVAWSKGGSGVSFEIQAAIEQVPNVNNQKVYGTLREIMYDCRIALGRLNVWEDRIRYYAPSTWKKAAFGHGHAKKEVEGAALADRLNAHILDTDGKKDRRQDALDALALAYARKLDTAPREA